MGKMVLNGVTYNSFTSNDGYYKETSIKDTVNSTASSLKLNNSYLNYDYLIFIIEASSTNIEKTISTNFVKQVSQKNSNKSILLMFMDSNTNLYVTPVDETTFTISRAGNGTITNVIGINFTRLKMQMLIPKMTSLITPYGTVSASSYWGTNFEPWRAFDGQNGVLSQLTYTWLPTPNEGANSWIMYEFEEPKFLYKMELITMGSGTSQTRTLTIQGRINNTWENCLLDGQNISCSFPAPSRISKTVKLNQKMYDAIRITSAEDLFVYNSYACGFDSIQILGY